MITLNILDVCSSHGIRLDSMNRALCPFHTEKTASFTVTPSKNLFYCFGCGAGGDSIRLAAMLENVRDGEIIKRLSLAETSREASKRLQNQQILKRQELFLDWINRAENWLYGMRRRAYFRVLDAEPSEEFWQDVKMMVDCDMLLISLEADPVSFYNNYKEAVDKLA